MVLLLFATQPMKLFHPEGWVFTDPDSKVSENSTPAAAEVLVLDELFELERELEIELLERDVETELLERELEIELLEREVETELLEREIELERELEIELLEREVDAALDAAPQPVPVTTGISAAPALLVPWKPNSTVWLGWILAFQLKLVAE